jgi:hypothetical protein
VILSVSAKVEVKEQLDFDENNPLNVLSESMFFFATKVKNQSLEPNFISLTH